MVQVGGLMGRGQFACWIIEPYGACTRSSECNCVHGYYRLESLIAFGTCICGAAAVAA